MAFTDETLGLMADDKEKKRKQKEQEALGLGAAAVSPMTPTTTPVTPPAVDPLEVKKGETKKTIGDAAFQTADPLKQKVAKIVFPTLNLDKSQVDVTGQFKMLNDRMSQISSELSPEKKGEFTSKLNSLTEQLNSARERASKSVMEAKSESEARDTRTQWAEVAETIGHAMAQLGAGLYGQKTGMDMSGVKFNKRDWTQDYNRIQQKLKGTLDTIESGLVRQEGDIAELRKETKQEMAQAQEMTEKDAAERKQLLINETKAKLQELNRVKDLKNKEQVENFQAASRQAQQAQDKLDRLEIMDKQQENDVLLSVMRQQGDITKAATKAAQSGDKVGIEDATKKAEALEQGISALYTSKELSGKEKVKKLEEARDLFVKAGFAPEKANQILEQSTSGFIFKSFEPEKAATSLREQFTQGQAVPQSQPPVATQTASSPKSAVDFIANKNPNVPRSVVIEQLKKANRVPADYQE
jgi:hypothetical protein